MVQLSDWTLGDYLEHWAKVTPDKEYIVYSDRDLRFTWKQFNDRVDDMARGLIAIGVTKGTHVGLWAQNVPDWLTFLYACAKIGAVCITVNTNYKQNELEYLCKDSDMHTLCLTDGTWESNYVDMAYTMLPELRECERGHLNSERFPMLKNVVYIGQEKYRGMYNTAEILLLGENTEDDEFQRLRKSVTCHDVVNMQYTSGTTGFPKGVMLTHYNIANDGFLTGEHMKFTQDDKLCVCVPLFHCFGVVLATMNCLTHGCTEVMVERFDPLVTLASVHKERCTALYGVPTMFIAELNHPMFDMFDLSCLRTGIMAGSLCPIELMRRVEEKMFLHVTSVYGLTESSPGMSQTRIDDPDEVRYTTVGRDYEFVDVDVTNDELYLYTSEEKHEIVAGRPYLVKFSAASQLDDLDFVNVTINNANLDDQAVTIKGVTFKGTFQPIVLGAQEGLDFNGGHLFLMANNTLMWPNTNNPLKPFRAYFTVNVDAGQSAGMPVRRGMPAHIGGPAQIVTGVDQISQEPMANSQKLMENGVLYIIKNGVKYNAQGQIVK